MASATRNFTRSIIHFQFQQKRKVRKVGSIFFLFAFFLLHAKAQDLPENTQQQLENQTDIDQSETEDDSYLVELEQFKRHAMNLNMADADELKQLRILTSLQIDNLISYRKIFGKFINIYELQAVPAWDVTTIRKLLPFITITTPVTLSE